MGGTLNWKSICAAVQGRGHAKKNIPCQDKVSRLEKNGVHVIALADGAGSANFSHFGAECVVNRISEFISENFFAIIACEDGKTVTQKIFSTLLRDLESESQIRGCELKDLASTILLAAVGGEKFFLAHLGDGVIGYLRADGLKIASEPDNGEFSNETVFVTSENAAERLKIFRGDIKSISGFVLMSDGTEQSLFDKRNRSLAPAIKRLMHRTSLIDAEILTPQLEDALKSVIAQKTQDDCSIALLARNSKILPPLKDLPREERREVYRIENNFILSKICGKISRCERICEILKRPITLRQISRRLQVKIDLRKKKSRRLQRSGAICDYNASD